MKCGSSYYTLYAKLKLWSDDYVDISSGIGHCCVRHHQIGYGVPIYLSGLSMWPSFQIIILKPEIYIYIHPKYYTRNLMFSTMYQK